VARKAFSLMLGLAIVCVVLLSSCGYEKAVAIPARQNQNIVTVGVTKAARHPLRRELTVSSELVPFQEIDVYAKESGYVSKLLVDYGTHVKQGQLMAILEIPELQATVRQDESAVKSLQDQITNAQHQQSRIEAQHRVLHLQYDRLKGVADSKPGLVAQQEVDDLQGRDLAAEAQVEAAKSNVEAARSTLAAAESKLERDRALYAYAQITAPFSGVVTQRYANLGALMQAGTSSSTQAMPLVKLSQEDLYRLVIPVPESYVGSIRLGDPVTVRVPALNSNFPGKIARFSTDVHESTRTMHTEVDVPNPKGTLMPGVYAEATLTLNKSEEALTVPLSTVAREGDHASVVVVDSSGKVEIRQVTLGMETDNDVEIVSGLKDGEQVVVSDRAGLKAGQEVQPQAVPAASYQSKS
jgi:RND family efflux transporter MFP subunit